MNLFRNFNFSFLSFILGAIVATVIWWAISLSKPLFEQMLASYRQKQRERALQGSADLENSYRKIVFRQTQGAHLAASLFALDEIVEEPRLLAPPSYVEPNAPHPRIEITEQAIPYLPNYPEIAAVYGGPTLSIPEAVSGGVNLIITGQPGTGKTTALAHLASQIVNRRPEAEALHEKIPFFIHAADLNLPLKDPKKAEDFLLPIIDKLIEGVSLVESGKLPGFVEYAFHSGRALLLLDGVDELTPPAIAEVAAYLRVILRQFPRTGVITTSTPDYADGLIALGFAPMTLMPWTVDQQRRFLAKWAGLWQKYIAVETWAQTNTVPVDPTLLNRWLLEGNFGLTPLEYTLKLWAAYAGDARGARPTDAIEAHLRRLLPVNAPLEALYTIGTQASLNGLSLFDVQRAKEWTKAFEPAAPLPPIPGAESAPANPENASPETMAAPPASTAPAGTGPLGGTGSLGAAKGTGRKNTGQLPRPASLVSQMTISGILAAHGGSRVRFAHPVYLGFLAGKGLGFGANLEPILKQPTWVGQTTTLRYLAAFGDATEPVNYLLSLEDNLLLRPRLAAARLLRESPKNAPWRNAIIGALIQIMQDEDAATALRGQAMAAFALSGDSNAGALFRQLMLSPSNELRRLAALGAGVVRDAKSVEALIEVLGSSAGAARQAACLALVEINNPEALGAIANALIGGDEQLRIAAAEALANNTDAGYETLRDGVTNEDILVRRATVYGLARIHQEWARELLGRIPTTDDQWVVRNAAVEVLDELQRPNAHIPRRKMPDAETPWLIEFAGKHGMGVTPGQPATDLYLLALKDENPEYQLAALHALKNSPQEGVIAALYQFLYGVDPEMKDGAFRVLSEMALGGVNLPHPMQFGLG